MIKVNNQEIKFDKFPNGETLVNTDVLNNVLPINGEYRIDFKWVNDEDLLHLYFVLNHLNYLGYFQYKLYIYYMPYSRMDRSQNGSCFTLRYISRVLNCMIDSLDEVFIVEPHSDVTLACVAHSKRINFISPLMQHILSLHPDIDMICYPDKGAKQRFQDDAVTLPVVYCNKIRDFDTGEIKGLELDGDVNVNGKNVLILDDLCSKGGTFYHTANKLKESGANDVYLGVCHMERTVEYGQILEFHNKQYTSPIKHIYCSDSMLISHISDAKNLTVYSMDEFLHNKQIKETCYE